MFEDSEGTTLRLMLLLSLLGHPPHLNVSNEWKCFTSSDIPIAVILVHRLMSRALMNLHTSAAFIKPKSETSEPETSRISQEASANANKTSSLNNFLRLAIAATANLISPGKPIAISSKSSIISSECLPRTPMQRLTRL